VLPIDGIGRAITRGRGYKYLPAAFIVLAVALTILRVAWRPSKLDLGNLQIVKLTDSGKAQDVAISGDGEYVVYSLANGDAESLRLRQANTQSDIELLPAGPGFHGLTFSPDGSHIYLVRSDEKDPFFKYLYSIATSGGASRRLVSDVDSPVSFSPDGEHLVYEHCLQPKNDIDLKIATIDGTDERILATLNDASGFMFQPGPSWSPDGETVAFPAFLLGKQHLWVLYAVSVRDGTMRRLYTSRDEIGRPVWLPDSRKLIIPQFMTDARRTQLWTIAFPSGEARPMTHDLSDYGSALGITRDGRVIAATTTVADLNVWIAPAANPNYGQQITHDGNPTLEVAEAFDGKLLTLGANGVPWIMNADGSQKKQFADVRNAVWPTPCGKFVVFQTNDTGMPALLRVDRAGDGIRKLANGHLWAPACSADGRFVFYVTTEQPQKIWRVSIEGGNSEELAEVMGNQVTGRLAASPDGVHLAYPFTQYGHVPSDGWQVAIIRATDGALVRTLSFPGGGTDLHWSPDGKSLQYLLSSGKATNLWEQSLKGGGPKQLTNFIAGEVSSFSWSSNHQRLFLTRGNITSDVVLLRNFR